MKTPIFRTKSRVALCALCIAMGSSVWAFPPAPCHTIYGVVRDELGNPIMDSSAVVTLVTATGIQIKTCITPNLAPGMNYRLQVPMDAGLTSDSYKTNALKPTVPFTLNVTYGSVTYLPIELKGSYKNLGKFAQSTHLDLTMGVDSDGDGLPDAWEYELIAQLGGILTLADIKPGDDSDGDGLSNIQEYLAGTYAFDPEDGIMLNIVGFNHGCPLLDFLTVKGRFYTIRASANLSSWSDVSFSLPAEAQGASLRYRHAATDTRIVRAEVSVPTNGSQRAACFYKLMVQ